MLQQHFKFHNPYRKISPAANICRKFAANIAASLQQTFAANLPQPFYHANEGCGKNAANIIMQIRFAASLRQLFAASLRQLFVANLQELHIYTNVMCVDTFILSLSNYTATFLKSQFLSLYKQSLKEFLQTREI